LRIIKKLCADGDYADINDILIDAEKQGIPEDKAENILAKLHKDGEIIEKIH